MSDISRRIIELAGSEVDYGTRDLSMSPFFSDMGLGFRPGEAGIGSLHLHYNRKTITLPGTFLDIGIRGPVRSRQGLEAVRQEGAGQEAAFGFFDRNAWLVELDGSPAACLDLRADPAPELHEIRLSLPDPSHAVAACLVPTLDSRDPDIWVPVLLGLRAVRGSLEAEGDARVLALPDGEGRLVLALAIQVLDVDEPGLLAVLGRAPDTVREAGDRYRDWLAETLDGLDRNVDFSGPDAPLLAEAVLTLVQNCCLAPGLLRNHISCFPSRGGYPTHFLWDACFQNLGLEFLHPRLAEDSLLQLTDTLRCDGKMPSFLCSTWLRPHESQPPLVGWAALRLLDQPNGRAFAARILDPLAANCRWWLAQRMSRNGLLFSHHPIETGWDNTPRFDAGPIEALDMNSYLIVQLRACSRMGRLLGRTDLSAEMDAAADRLSERLLALTCDKADNLFYDRVRDTGEFVRIRTPACFLPLWAGVGLPEDRARRMIETVLLDPGSFNGPVPMPSVGCGEAAYEPRNWWRGPMWPPVAYLMLELLDRYGYQAEREAIAGRIYGWMAADGRLSELFHSDTGMGDGCRQQGWTAGVVLRLKHEYPALGIV